jgi:ABC-type lipoprotein release transport system permease subunit
MGVVFGGATALLPGVAFLATVIPARRAAAVNPVDAVRYR